MIYVGTLSAAERSLAECGLPLCCSILFVGWHFDVVFFNCWGLGLQRKKNFSILLFFFVYFVWVCYDAFIDLIYLLSSRHYRL
jgi:hypothetical protein